MSGFPGSGKSTFVNTYFSHYVRINMDTLKTKVKCFKECELSMKNNSNIIIDNLNTDKKTRKYYIDFAKKYNYTYEAIINNCDMWTAYHNSHYRAFKNNINHIPLIVYRKFNKSYEKPETSEGFNNIYETNFFPPTNDLYYKYYF